MANFGDETLRGLVIRSGEGLAVFVQERELARGFAVGRVIGEEGGIDTADFVAEVLGRGEVHVLARSAGHCKFQGDNGQVRGEEKELAADDRESVFGATGEGDLQLTHIPADQDLHSAAGGALFVEDFFNEGMKVDEFGELVGAALRVEVREAEVFFEGVL